MYNAKMEQFWQNCFGTIFYFTVFNITEPALKGLNRIKQRLITKIVELHVTFNKKIINLKTVIISENILSLIYKF